MIYTILHNLDDLHKDNGLEEEITQLFYEVSFSIFKFEKNPKPIRL